MPDSKEHRFCNDWPKAEAGRGIISPYQSIKSGGIGHVLTCGNDFRLRGNFGAHRNELFGGRGVNPYSRVELSLSRAAIHRNRDALNNFP